MSEKPVCVFCLRVVWLRLKSNFVCHQFRPAILPHLWSKDALLISACPFSHSSPDVEKVYANWSTSDSERERELVDFCVMTMTEMEVQRTC